jgi:L-amino acid N-acyltransferase YncA
MTIRDAVEADLPAIVDIFNSTVPTRTSTAVLEPVTVADRREWFNEHTPDRHPLWVAEIDGAIAGWLSIHSFIGRCAYRGTVELSVYIHQGFRRRGVAGALLEKAVADAPRLEITALVGLILGHNTASLRLFGRFGFEQWGLLPRVTRLEGVERDIVIVGRHTAQPTC